MTKENDSGAERSVPSDSREGRVSAGEARSRFPVADSALRNGFNVRLCLADLVRVADKLLEHVTDDSAEFEELRNEVAPILDRLYRAVK